MNNFIPSVDFFKNLKLFGFLELNFIEDNFASLNQLNFQKACQSNFHDYFKLAEYQLLEFH
jgi:hypothetical protein